MQNQLFNMTVILTIHTNSLKFQAEALKTGNIMTVSHSYKAGLFTFSSKHYSQHQKRNAGGKIKV